jgi:hypothetical protein
MAGPIIVTYKVCLTLNDGMRDRVKEQSFTSLNDALRWITYHNPLSVIHVEISKQEN